jgi:hypothetical protein
VGKGMSYKLRIQQAQKLGYGYKKQLRKTVGAAIHDYNQSHPEWILKEAKSASLHKRIVGHVYNDFLRLIADREIVNWLENNRYQLHKIQETQGSFREVVFDLMQKEND